MCFTVYNLSDFSGKIFASTAVNVVGADVEAVVALLTLASLTFFLKFSACLRDSNTIFPISGKFLRQWRCSTTLTHFPITSESLFPAATFFFAPNFQLNHSQQVDQCQCWPNKPCEYSITRGVSTFFFLVVFFVVSISL